MNTPTPPHDPSQIELPLHAVGLEPREPSERPPLLVLLHGFGANERDLIGIAPELDPRLRAIAARAPIDLAHAGMPGGYAWFNLIFRPEGIDYDRQSALDSTRIASDFVRAAQKATATTPERTLVLGFSQGAMMAHAILLTGTPAIAGAACLSGRAVDELFTDDRDWSGLDGFPLFVSHGALDDVIPIQDGGHAIRAYYEQTPVDMTYVEEPTVGHSIGPSAIAQLRAWIADRINSMG